MLLLGLFPLVSAAEPRQAPDDHHQHHQHGLPAKRADSAAKAETTTSHRHSGPIGHRFRDAKHWSKVFDDPKRLRWQRPDRVIAALELKPSMVIADIGAGTGFFAVRLARAVKSGKVIAIDIERSMIDYLGRRAARERLNNLTAVLGQTDDPRIPEAVDLVFICNTYHHIAERVRYFRALRAKIKPGGTLAIVDFRAGKIPVGPPAKQRIYPPQLDKELSQAGYRRLKLLTNTLPYQYIAVYGVQSS